MKLKGTEVSGRKVRIEYCLENPRKEKKISFYLRLLTGIHVDEIEKERERIFCKLFWDGIDSCFDYHSECVHCNMQIFLNQFSHQKGDYETSKKGE